MLPMAMALYGLAGYGNYKEKQRDQKRQDEDDAFKREERDRKREDWKKEDKLNTDLSDAYAPRTTMEGIVTQSDAGQVFSATPENARAMQDTLAAEAELRGDPAPTQQAGHAVTGSMTKGHQIATGAVPAESADTPEAGTRRAIAAYRQNGQAEKANQMEASVLDLESKKLGLTAAQAQAARDIYNAEVDSTLSDPAGWQAGAAKAFSKSKLFGLNGVSVVPKPSDDGKSVSFVGTDSSGKTVFEKAYPNDDRGRAQLQTELMQLKPEDRIKFINERFKQTQDADKTQSEIELNKDKGAYYRANAGAKDATAQNTVGKLSGPDEIALEAIVGERKLINKALIDAQAGGAFDPLSDGVRGLQTKLAALSIKEQQILARYQQPSGPRPDPLGKLGAPAASSTGTPTASAGRPAVNLAPAGQPGAQASTRVAPGVQAARDSDARSILQSELAKAQQRLAAGDERAQVDIQSISNELSRMGAPVAGMAMQEAVAPAPQAQPAPAATPLVTMAATKRADPLAGKSRQQIREMKTDLQKERKRWAGNPNAGPRIAEIDALLDRIDKGRY